MYERPDVPKDNPNRNKIAVVVIMLVAVGLFVLGSTLWRLANVHSALGSGEVERALAAATVSDEAAQQLADAPCSRGTTPGGCAATWTWPRWGRRRLPLWASMTSRASARRPPPRASPRIAA